MYAHGLVFRSIREDEHNVALCSLIRKNLRGHLIVSFDLPLVSAIELQVVADGALLWHAIVNVLE